MTRLRSLLLAFVLCAGLVPATASADDFDRFGPYLGLNAAWGYPLFEDQAQDVIPGATLDPSWGLNTRAGIRLLSFLALEAQYEWMNDFKVDSPSPFPPDVNIMGHTLTGNVKFYIPVWRIQPYLLAGFGFTRYKFEATGFSTVTDNFFAGRVGGGADIYLTKSWALNAEVSALLTASDVSTSLSSDDLQSLHYLSASLGLMYRF